MSVGWSPENVKYPCAAGAGSVVDAVKVVDSRCAGANTRRPSTSPNRCPVTACTSSPASR